MWAFYAILQESDLGNQFIRRVLPPCCYDIVHASKNGAKYELSIISQLMHYLLRVFLEKSVEEVDGLLTWWH
jgi:hypothetical protein